MLFNIKTNYNQGWLFFGFFHLPEKTCQYKNFISMSRFANQYKICYKRNRLESWLFAGFCHHPVMTTSVHTHAYHYPLEQKQICEKSLYTVKI